MKSVLEGYCRAWNQGDLDGLFALFRENAEYEGPSKRLLGRDAIRQMYQEALESGVTKDLLAKPMPFKRDTWAVVLYRQGQPVALKEFRFSGELIAGHNLIEDRNTIEQKLAV